MPTKVAITAPATTAINSATIIPTSPWIIAIAERYDPAPKNNPWPKESKPP